MILVKMAALALGLFLVGQEGADPKGKDAEANDEGKAAVEAWVDRAMSSEASKTASPLRLPYKVEAVPDEDVRKVFAKERIYSVHTKKLPRPDMVPKALQAVKLVCVKADGTVEPIKGEEGFKEFLSARLTGVRDDDQARKSLMTALRLAEEYHRSGDMKFRIPADSVTISHRGGAIVAAGKAEVTMGGTGDVRVSLTFGPSGDLKPEDVTIKGRVRSGEPLR